MSNEDLRRFLDEDESTHRIDLINNIRILNSYNLIEKSDLEKNVGQLFFNWEFERKPIYEGCEIAKYNYMTIKENFGDPSLCIIYKKENNTITESIVTYTDDVDKLKNPKLWMKVLEIEPCIYLLINNLKYSIYSGKKPLGKICTFCLKDLYDKSGNVTHNEVDCLELDKNGKLYYLGAIAASLFASAVGYLTYKEVMNYVNSKKVSS